MGFTVPPPSGIPADAQKCAHKLSLSPSVAPFVTCAKSAKSPHARMHCLDQISCETLRDLGKCVAKSKDSDFAKARGALCGMLVDSKDLEQGAASLVEFALRFLKCFPSGVCSDPAIHKTMDHIGARVMHDLGKQKRLVRTLEITNCVAVVLILIAYFVGRRGAST